MHSLLKRNGFSFHYGITHRHGFTLVEITIVMALLTTLSSVILFSNIKTPLQKGRDTNRKQDLNKMARYFEDYLNDQGTYPRENPAGNIEGAPWGGPFGTYASNLPSDPLAPVRQYYYQTDPTNQNMFVIYSLLENESDADIANTGCTGGCGPGRVYNYAVYSSNVAMVDGQPTYQGSTLGVSTQLSDPDTLHGRNIGKQITDPDGLHGRSSCNENQCGFCRQCGPRGGQDCGFLSRCINEENNWSCRFDIKCVF